MILKKEHLISLLLLSFATFAEEDNLCLKYETETSALQCHQITKENFVDPSIHRTCLEIAVNDNDRINCLHAIANKDFKENEVNLCKKLKSIDCFYKIGEYETYRIPLADNCTQHFQESYYHSQFTRLNTYGSEDAFFYIVSFISFPVGISKEINISQKESRALDHKKIYDILYSSRLGEVNYVLYDFQEEIQSETTISLTREDLNSILIDLDTKKAFCSTYNDDVEIELPNYKEFKEIVKKEIKIRFQ